MRRRFILALFLIIPAGATAAAYKSPVPGAGLVSRHTTIIFRANDNERGSRMRFDVSGDVSGPHIGKAVEAENGTTHIFRPAFPFEAGETVKVTVSRDGRVLESWAFTVSPLREPIPLNSFDLHGHGDTWPMAPHTAPAPMSGLSGALPADFPNMAVTTLGETAPGYIFMVNMLPFGGPPAEVQPYLMILDNDAVPVYFRKVKGALLDVDLRVQEVTGQLTWFENWSEQYYAMDTTYTVVDSFSCGNGYQTDLHELVVLDNGHALLMAYDPQPVDMSQVIAGGQPDATVIGLIVQELDPARNVVFQWRSWDHVPITDAYQLDLTAATVDYIHGNAIARAQDGNLLVSNRHTNDIIKIDRATGDIMWRMGGKHNEFTFINDVNDSTGFWRQHDIRVLPNGNLTLFDNGNLHDPPHSRAVEYQVDENNRTATLVWEYRNDPDTFGPFMGNVQRLPNGNTVIGWGGTNPNVTEVRPDGTKVFELTLDPGMFSYRAYRYPWSATAATPTLWQGNFDRSQQALTLHFDKFGDANVTQYVVYHGVGTQPVARLDSTVQQSIVVGGLPPGVNNRFRVSAIGPAGTVSPLSNWVSFVYPNTAPGACRLLAPLQDTTVDRDSTEFAWTSAPDVDGDAVDYRVDILYGDKVVITESAADTSVTIDTSRLAGGRTYRWTAVAMDFAEGTASPDTFNFTTPVPPSIVLHQNFPNPFNPETTIAYDLPRDTYVSLTVYNVLGQKVRGLVNETQSAGFREVTWDGADNSGSRVSSGIYFYRLSADGVVRSRKMILLK